MPRTLRLTYLNCNFHSLSFVEKFYWYAHVAHDVLWSKNVADCGQIKWWVVKQQKEEPLSLALSVNAMLLD